MAKRGTIDIHAILLAVGIVGGLISGILRPRFFGDADLALLTAALHDFAAGFDIAPAESLLRYGRPLIMIWACAAIPKAYYAAFLVVYLRAMALAFSATLLVITFGGTGFVMALSLYAIQNLITMPIYAYTTYFIAKNPMTPAIAPRATRLAFVGILAILAASAVEIFIAPTLFEILP